MGLIKQKGQTLTWFLATLGLALIAWHASARQITVFAAASLTDALKEIGSHYTQQTGVQVALNSGASSTLARQIAEGAAADIFFSADEARMNELEDKGYILKDSRVSRLSNSLVFVVLKDNPSTIIDPQDLAKPSIKRVALGDPRAAPIGVYAKQYLQRLELWDKIESKVVGTENVRSALAAVEAGNADVSIVYKTDAAISKNIRIVFAVPAAEGPKISYPVAIVKGTPKLHLAEQFLKTLCSEEAGKVFAKYGFIVLAIPRKNP
jgi:molybdate transport system substrate-binding protein